MARKGENIFKRKDGRWEARYEKGRDRQGKIIYGYCYGHSYKEARAKVLQAKIHVIQNECCDNTENAEKLSSICAEWLSSKKPVIAESSYIKYYSIVSNHILPRFGEKNLSDLEETDLINFCHALIEKQYSQRTSNGILSVLESILGYAKKNYSFQIRFEALKMPCNSKEARVLSSSEEKTFVEFLLTGLDCCKFGIIFALMTGLRIGEICALKWRNISMEEGFVKIEHTIQRIKNLSANSQSRTKIIISKPKTHHSQRIIPLSTDCIRLCESIGSFEKDSYVLTGTNEYMEPRTLQYRLAKYAGSCGLNGVHFHTLRHTFATRCIEVGFELKSLSEILGHASTRITLDRYVHSSLQTKRENMEKLPTLLANKSSNSAVMFE